MTRVPRATDCAAARCTSMPSSAAPPHGTRTPTRGLPDCGTVPPTPTTRVAVLVDAAAARRPVLLIMRKAPELRLPRGSAPDLSPVDRSRRSAAPARFHARPEPARAPLPRASTQARRARMPSTPLRPVPECAARRGPGTGTRLRFSKRTANGSGRPKHDGGLAASPISDGLPPTALPPTLSPPLSLSLSLSPPLSRSPSRCRRHRPPTSAPANFSLSLSPAFDLSLHLVSLGPPRHFSSLAVSTHVWLERGLSLHARKRGRAQWGVTYQTRQGGRKWPR